MSLRPGQLLRMRACIGFATTGDPSRKVSTWNTCCPVEPDTLLFVVADLGMHLLPSVTGIERVWLVCGIDCDGRSFLGWQWEDIILENAVVICDDVSA